MGYREESEQTEALQRPVAAVDLYRTVVLLVFSVSLSYGRCCFCFCIRICLCYDL